MYCQDMSLAWFKLDASVKFQLLSWIISACAIECRVETHLCGAAPEVSSAYTAVSLCGLIVVGISPM